MRDRNDPLYLEWKRKYDAGVERKKKEDAEWKKREEKPGFKLITRGPRKGQLVPKNYHERRAERQAIQWARNSEKINASNEAYAQRMAESDAKRVQNSRPIPVEKKAEGFSPEIIIAFVLVSALSIASLLVAKFLATLGILGITLFVDVIAYSAFGPKGRRTKYLPLIWWL